MTEKSTKNSKSKRKAKKSSTEEQDQEEGPQTRAQWLVSASRLGSSDRRSGSNKPNGSANSEGRLRAKIAKASEEQEEDALVSDSRTRSNTESRKSQLKTLPTKSRNARQFISTN